MSPPTHKMRLVKAARGLRHLQAQPNRRELYLRPQGVHCQEWWWCEIRAGHRGPCLSSTMKPDETL